MYCQNCGVMNPEGADTCRICGAELVPAKAPSKKSWMERRKKATQEAKEAEVVRKELGIESPAPAQTSEVPPAEPTPDQLQEVPSGPQVQPRATSYVVTDECPICGNPKDESEDLCEMCKEYREQEAVGQFDEEASPETDKSAVDDWEAEPVKLGLGKVGGVLISLAGFLGVVYGLLTVVDISGIGIPGPVVCFTGLMVVFGFGAIVGGYSAIQQKNAIYALLGGIFGILSVGYFVGAALSIIGLLLVLASYNEFEEHEASLKLPKL